MALYAGSIGMSNMEDTLTWYIHKQAEAKENFVAVYLKETGLKVDDIVLVEQHDGNTI